MTHGREKSDLSIAAMKPTNKLGQLGAESVERREGDRREHGRATHAPDSEPGKPRSLTVYEKQRSKGRRNGSPLCSTM